MDDHQEPNLDSDDSSYFQKMVVLKDWWLIKCSKEFEGKRFGVAGIEVAASVESRAVRVFTSSPIIKAFDDFTLQASDGVYIILRGLLNKERAVESGFSPEISREFIFGFPSCWEKICNNCFGGVPFSTGINKACFPILSPCKNSKRNLEDSPAECRDKSSVAETNTAEIIKKDGRSGVSRAREKKTSRSKSRCRRQSKAGGKSAEEERKLELSKVQYTTNDGDHGSEGLDEAKSGDVEKHECEALDNEDNERKLDESKVQNCIDDGEHVSEGLDKAKRSDVEKDECEAIDNEVISPADECGRNQTGADNADKVISTSATGESLTSEQRKGELKVTRVSPHSLVKDLDKSSKRKSKKSGKTHKSDGNVVEPMNHYGAKVKSAENKRKLDVSEVQKTSTNDIDQGSEGLNKAKRNGIEKDECVAINNEVISPVAGCGKTHSGTDSVENLISKNAKESLTSESEQRKGKQKATKTHSLAKGLDNSSKPTKKVKSKKSEKTLKSDWNVVEPMNHSGSKAEENLFGEKIKRKIDFDLEVTPDKEAKKQKSNSAPTDSLGQKRSRSGRVLVSSLEFWRNQVPVYDLDRNLVQVKEGHETSSTPYNGKGSNSRKPRR